MDPVAAFIEAACVPRTASHASGTLERAEMIRARYPHVARESVHTAAILADEAAVRQFVSSDAANATVNRDLEVLKRAFRLAARKELVSHVPEFPEDLSEKHNVRQGFLEHRTYLALRRALPEDYADVLDFGYLVGWRKGSIHGLRWPSIDRSANGLDLMDDASEVRLETGEAPSSVSCGPRVGLRGAAGNPWRFWATDEPTVSAYRAHSPRRRRTQAR